MEKEFTNGLFTGDNRRLAWNWIIKNRLEISVYDLKKIVNEAVDCEGGIPSGFKCIICHGFVY